MAGCYKFLGAWILCSYICQHRSGHNTPVSLQQDKCSAFVLHFFFPLFCNFSFYINETSYTFKGQAWGAELWEWAIKCISGYIVNIPLQRCRTSMTKALVTAQSLGLKDLVWSQFCSSLLHSHLNGQVQPFTSDLLNYIYHIKHPHICNSVSVLLILIFWSKDLNLG